MRVEAQKVANPDFFILQQKNTALPIAEKTVYMDVRFGIYKFI